MRWRPLTWAGATYYYTTSRSTVVRKYSCRPCIKAACEPESGEGGASAASATSPKLQVQYKREIFATPPAICRVVCAVQQTRVLKSDTLCVRAACWPEETAELEAGLRRAAPASVARADSWLQTEN